MTGETQAVDAESAEVNAKKRFTQVLRYTMRQETGDVTKL